jgi:hypothetical protein
MTPGVGVCVANCGNTIGSAVTPVVWIAGAALVVLAVVIVLRGMRYQPFISTNERMNRLLPEWQRRKS